MPKMNEKYKGLFSNKEIILHNIKTVIFNSQDNYTSLLKKNKIIKWRLNFILLFRYDKIKLTDIILY